MASKLVTNMMDACSGNFETPTPMVITVDNISDISSPNFPQQYPENIKCSWRIIADDNQTIELSFLELDIENL